MSRNRRCLTMHSKEFFSSLGFSEYESKVIISLTKLKIASSKEINLDSGVPQNKIYGVIKKLENLGMISTIPSSTKKYKLINIKTFIEKRISEKQKEIEQLKENYKNIEELEDKDEFIFSLIKGQKAIMNKITEKNSEVQKEILGVQRNWQVWGEGLRKMEKSIKKGVEVKIIGIIDNETKKRAIEWKKVGCEVRAYNKKFGEYPLRFSIFDNKEARITLGKPEISNAEDYITIWTKSKPLINMLRNQFMQMWKESEKF